MIYNGNLAVDDRGIVRFVNDFDFKNVKRFYQVENHTCGFIRAFHGHKIEGKYVYVSSGTILLCVVDMDTEKIETHILTARQPKILYIPPNNYNGFKNLEENTSVIFYSTTTLEESKGDDIRKPYDTWNVWENNYR